MFYFIVNKVDKVIRTKFTLLLPQPICVSTSIRFVYIVKVVICTLDSFSITICVWTYLTHIETRETLKIDQKTKRIYRVQPNEEHSHHDPEQHFLLLKGHQSSDSYPLVQQEYPVKTTKK